MAPALPSSRSHDCVDELPSDYQDSAYSFELSMFEFDSIAIQNSEPQEPLRLLDISKPIVEDSHNGKPAPPPGMRSQDFPDGGLKAWSVVLGAWCCFFVSFGWVSSIGVFQSYYQTNQLSSYSASVVSWIPSVEIFMLQVLAPVYGKIFDGYGARYLLVFGTFFHILGLMATSLSTNYYQFFLAQSICSGLGASAIFYAGTNSTSTWFIRRRALALGIVASGSGLGGVLVP